jgi:hypothetical protein
MILPNSGGEPTFVTPTETTWQPLEVPPKGVLLSEAPQIERRESQRTRLEAIIILRCVPDYGLARNVSNAETRLRFSDDCQ